MASSLATSSVQRGRSTSGVAPEYRRRKSLRNGATSVADSNQPPLPTAPLSCASVAGLGGRGMDRGQASPPRTRFGQEHLYIPKLSFLEAAFAIARIILPRRKTAITC